MSVADRLSSKLPKAVQNRAERGPVVTVVKLHGVITPTTMPASPLGRGVINLPAVESALTRAFEHDRAQAVAVTINSPGGAATQSALVADRIRGLAEEKKLPVLAFCEDVAASGGYWLACAADEIYAHATSMIGSIGVVSQGFGLHGLLERFGVERRLYTAGEAKARLDPFLPEKTDDVKWLSGMQAELHEQFKEWVQLRRGAKLAGGDNQNLFSGEVWTGGKAASLGLVDGMGTMRSVIERRFPDAELVTVEGRKPLLARLGVGPAARTGSPMNFGGLLETLEHRAVWARYGL